MIEPVVLQGRFVLLRPLQPSDAEAIRRIGAGPRETFRWTHVPEPAQVEAYLGYALEQMRDRKALAFAICLPSGQWVGSTRLFDLQRWNWDGGDPRAGEDVLDACEIGWTWLAPHVQRTAVNTEAKLLLLRHAFETWRCHRVTLKTDERNDRSRRAIERLGAHLDGVLRAHQPGVDGKPRNTAYYTILAQEWPAVRARLEGRLAP